MIDYSNCLSISVIILAKNLSSTFRPRSLCIEFVVVYVWALKKKQPSLLVEFIISSLIEASVIVERRRHCNFNLFWFRINISWRAE